MFTAEEDATNAWHLNRGWVSNRCIFRFNDHKILMSNDQLLGLMSIGKILIFHRFRTPILL